jgi:hypothetical protein
MAGSLSFLPFALAGVESSNNQITESPNDQAP